ncbi:MAG: hypothetical protein IJZ14_02440 [Oscillospiraceae bacterium]|nr:hypothetical protein [Oscillospiraceae bacterium]
MKLRTSFFNKTALRKDILRYSPIWALYTLFLLLVLFGMAEYSRADMARDTVDFLKAMAWINLFYGGVCGMFLLMDLFSNRLCNALHALPVRREGWLVTHILSGVLFSLIPNLLVTALGALMLWEYAYLAPVWLAISMMQFLFFFGTAVLSAMCAGNLLGSIAIYGITHLITLFLGVVAQLLYQPLLYGVRLDMDAFYRFFPLQKMTDFDYAKVKMLYQNVKPQLQYNGLEGEAWLYVGLCAAVGVIALLLAGAVYRRRNLESAGDFISLKPIAPVFLLVATIGAGAFLYMFSDLVGNKTYLFLVLGMIIGYFAGKMLLERTLKVFGKKSLLTLAVLLIIFGGSLGLTWLDPLGITTYIPKAENIEAVYVVGADKGFYYLADSLISYTGIREDDSFSITDPAEIKDLQEFHRNLTNYRPAETDGVLCDVHICYKLKDGRTVNRYYEVGRDTPLGKEAGKYFCDMRYIFGVSDTAVLYNAFEAVSIDVFTGKDYTEFKLTEQQDIADLLNAIAADCEAGTMAQNWAYHNETGKEKDYNLEFSVNDEARKQGIWDVPHFYLHVYEDSVNTRSYINARITAKGSVTAE